MESNTIYITDLTCRVCLQDSDIANDLCDTVDGEGRVCLKDLFKRVANVEISLNEVDLPTRLCQDCTDRLVGAYEFILSVESSEQLLTLRNQTYLENEEKTFVIAEVVNEDFFLDDVNPEESQNLEVLDDEFQMPTNDDVIQNDIKYENTEEETLLNEPDLDDSSDTKPEPVKFTLKTDMLNKRRQRVEIGSRLGTNVTSKWQKCDQCQRSFAKIETLEKHMRIVHTSISPERIAAITPKPLNEQLMQCDYCPRTFVRKDNLQRHLIACHADEADVLAIEKELDQKKHTYKRAICPHCGESFSQASLIIHIRRHTGENPYECKDCGKGFPRRQDLIIHQRYHTGERPHVCTICGKTFIRPNKLSRHMRIHTGQRPYKCTECDKSFAQSNDLKIHLRRHTGEKPYKCGICGEGFICGAALNSHRNTKSHHEPVDDLVDPYEKFRVNTRNNLKYKSAF